MPPPHSPGPPSPPVPTTPPGAALERTTLAWVRTGLGFAVVSVLLVRLATVEGRTAAAVAVGVVGLVASGALGLWMRHRQVGREARVAARTRVAEPVAVGLVAGLVVLLAVAGLVLLLP